MPDSRRLPALFIGHGSPMNTFEDNRFTQRWADTAARIDRPEAIVVVSAHWYGAGTAVTSMANPQTIHDFSGFPPELSRFEYPAPGSPHLAHRVAQMLPGDVLADDHMWGLDHGAWSVLARMYPEADVPVVQLSIDARLEPRDHMRLGAALNPLRDEGVLVLASGNVVHNLSLIDWSMSTSGFDWADRFDAIVRSVMTSDPSALPTVMSGDDWTRAAPTPEHFIPLLYIAGAAAATGTIAEVLTDGPTMGSLTMTSYAVP